jgi:hypothetical protein
MPAENRVLRKVFRFIKYRTRSFIICAVTFKNSDGIAMGDGLDNQGIMAGFPAGTRDFSLLWRAGPTLGPTQPPIQLIPWDIFPRVKRPGREVLFVRVFKNKSDNCFIISPLAPSLLTMRGKLERKKVYKENGGSARPRLELGTC